MRSHLAVACLLAATFAAGCFEGTGGDSTTTTPAPTGTTTTTATTTMTTTTTTAGGPLDQNEVLLLDNTFVPLRLDVDNGTTVTFLNQGATSHTVTIHAVGDPLDVWVKDVVLTSGQNTTHTFDRETTFHVWCKFHGQMTSGMAMTVEST